MTAGFRDTTLLTLPTGWDATELQKLTLRDGYTYAQVAGDLNAALSAINGEIMNDPLWASLCYWTDMPTFEYRMGNSGAAERHTEYGQPTPYRGVLDGHMLPLEEWEAGLGWTKDYLRKGNREQIGADVQEVVRKVRDRFRQTTLTRLLKRGDDSGVALNLGSAGLSPGFATTAASTGVDFTPPSMGGTSFANTHEHYVGISGGAWTLAAFQDMKSELREHGHEPPYDFITGPSDEAAIRLLTGFVATPQWGVNYASTVSVATVDGMADGNGNYMMGVIEDIRIRIMRGVPQYYGFAWKSYGARSQRNPLRVRLEDGENAFRAYAELDPRQGGSWPLAYLVTRFNFGVGVGDRTNGTPRYNNNATWADGTPT